MYNSRSDEYNRYSDHSFFIRRLEHLSGLSKSDTPTDVMYEKIYEPIRNAVRNNQWYKAPLWQKYAHSNIVTILIRRYADPCLLYVDQIARVNSTTYTPSSCENSIDHDKDPK